MFERACVLCCTVSLMVFLFNFFWYDRYMGARWELVQLERIQLESVVFICYTQSLSQPAPFLRRCLVGFLETVGKLFVWSIPGISTRAAVICRSK